MPDFSLPGITKPTSSRADSRVVMAYGADFEVDVFQVSEDQSIPRLDIFVTQQVKDGPELFYQSTNNGFVFQRVKNGVKTGKFRLAHGTDVNMKPGLYTMSVFLRGELVTEKTVTVENVAGRAISSFIPAPPSAGGTSETEGANGEFVIELPVTGDDPIVEYDTETGKFRTTNTPGGLDIDAGEF